MNLCGNLNGLNENLFLNLFLIFKFLFIFKIVLDF